MQAEAVVSRRRQTGGRETLLTRTAAASGTRLPIRRAGQAYALCIFSRCSTTSWVAFRVSMTSRA